MGTLFRRKKKNGEEGLVWRMKYRAWDARTKDWGDYKFESAGTTVRSEAEKILEDREREEEKKSLGLVRSVATKSLRNALLEFLDETKVMDRLIPERNVRATHPILDVEVEGKAWWIRTLDFARDIDRCFDRVEIGVLLQLGAVDRFSRFLEQEGGARRKGVSQTSRSKTLKWLRRLCGWAVKMGYLAMDPTREFKVPGEAVRKRDRLLESEQIARFLEEYRDLPLKARIRVGLALWTGARSGEIETIQVADISPESSLVRRQIYKKAAGAQERTVRVPDHLMKDLVEWIELNELGPNDRILPIRCQAGVKFLRRWGTSARGLRRTLLTRLQDSGASLRVIQEAAGHSQLGTTQRYLGVGERAVNDALALLRWDESGTTGGTKRGTKSAKRGTNRGTKVGAAVRNG